MKGSCIVLPWVLLALCGEIASGAQAKLSCSDCGSLSVDCLFFFFSAVSL